MWGAGVPTVYYGFLCNRALRVFYWTTVSTTAPFIVLWLTFDQTTATALGCTYLTLDPRFASPQFRHWRASLYAGFGLSSIIFVVHGVYLHGWDFQKTRMSLIYMGWMGLSNLAGAAIYAARVRPWLPSKRQYAVLTSA